MVLCHQSHFRNVFTRLGSAVLTATLCGFVTALKRVVWWRLLYLSLKGLIKGVGHECKGWECDELKINPASKSSCGRTTKRKFPRKMLPDGWTKRQTLLWSVWHCNSCSPFVFPVGQFISSHNQVKSFYFVIKLHRKYYAEICFKMWMKTHKRWGWSVNKVIRYRLVLGSILNSFLFTTAATLVLEPALSPTLRTLSYFDRVKAARTWN
jgi:hypothetical protein